MQAANNELDLLLNSFHYQANYTPPPENIYLRICGENIGSEGNFVIVSGLPKAGKSSYITAIIASAVNTNPIFGIKLYPNIARSLIGYFDTESAQHDFYKNISRIKYSARSETIPNINGFNTRQCNAATNRLLIEHYIQNYPASIVVIDGLLDIISNFNDEKESRLVVDWLKKITAENKILIIGVIHTGKKDGFTLGHYGSMLDRYAQSVLEVTKEIDYNLYRLSAKYLRSSAGFQDIAIQYAGGEFIECNLPPPKKENRR